MRCLRKRKIKNLIAYHERMRATLLFIREQHNNFFYDEFWDKAAWHYRFAERLKKLL